MPTRKLFKIVGYVGITILFSKLFGLARDLVIAQFYGTSITADAYNYAYLLTGNILILIGGLGGPFHSATIAILTRIKDNAKESGSFLIKIFLSAFLALSLIAIGVIYFRHNLVEMIIPAIGIAESYREKLWELTASYLLIMSPLIIISGLVGILCGIANVYGGFFWPSFAPAFPSLTIIIFVILSANRGSGMALAIGTLIGAILELIVQLPYLIKACFYENIKLTIIKKQKAFKDYLDFLGPALLSTTIGQITVYIDGFFCSGLAEGSWTATIFANRLIQLPLGILVTSFLVPFFPRFSELAHNKNLDSLKQTSIIVIKSLWFLTLPIAAFLLLFAKPIVEIIFQRGAFDERSTTLVSGILIALLLSMVAYVARDTLTRVFYALGNSRIPLMVAILAIILKVVFNNVLVEKYGVYGIAFSTSLVTLLNFIFLNLLLKKEIGNLGWISHSKSLLKMAVSTFVMFIIGFLILNSFSAILLSSGFIFKLFFLIGSFIVLFLIYFGLALSLKIKEAEIVLKEIKKRL